MTLAAVADPVRAEVRALIRVATLGPEGTSSEHAAKAFIRRVTGRAPAEGDIGLHDTYEDAEAMVIEGRSSHLLVAAAYGCRRFFMSNALRPDHANHFALDTPPYVLAARTCRCQLPDAVRIATHPAPEEVIDQLLPSVSPGFAWYMVKPTDSTAKAARMVADGDVEVALTTEDARRRFELVTISRERTIPMFWLVFTKAQ